MNKLIVTAVCVVALAGPAQGGWFGDAVKDALHGLGERAVHEASEGTYEGAKKGAEKVVDDATNQAPERAEAPEPAPNTPPTASTAAKAVPAPRAPAPRVEAPAAAPATTGSDVGRHGTPASVDVDLPDLSAELYNRDQEGEESRSRFYSSGSLVRVEPISGDGMQGTTITDLRHQVVYILSPEEKSYLEFPYGDQGGIDLSAFEGGNPCDEYRHSKRLGAETVGGRKAVRWQCTVPVDEFDAKQETVWVDTKLGIPVRSEDSNGHVYEMRDIDTNPQPESLFRVPAGYKKQAMPLPFFGAAAQPHSSSGEPFAPKLEPTTTAPPKDPAEKAGFDMEILMLRSLRVPPKSEVGFPPYPGAKVSRYIPPTKGEINGEPYHGLPMVELVTEDDPATVAAWYRARLPGWQEGEFLMGTFFWPGGDFHPLKISGEETPSVGVFGIQGKATSHYAMPTARTNIDIRYKPQG